MYICIYIYIYIPIYRKRGFLSSTRSPLKLIKTRIIEPKLGLKWRQGKQN